MLFKSATLLALGASAAVGASPLDLFRRQSASASLISSAVGSATSAIASATESASSAVESVTGSAAQSTAVSSVEVTATTAEATGLSSAISEASGVTGTAAPEPTGTSTNGTEAELAFGCPTGYSLTYVIGSSTYPDVEIQQASAALAEWGTAIPPPIMSLNSTGSEVGAMRSWEVMNLTVTETLTNVTQREDGGLQQSWNLTAPLNVSEALIIANATSDLTLFTNTTSNNVTSVQFYVNFCVNDQPAGLTLYAELATAYLTGLNDLFSNSTASATSSTMMSSMASSAVASATDSAASGVATATEAVSSGLSEGVSGASSVGSVAASGASSVASAGIGGVTSALGDATSAVAGAVTGLIPTRRA